MAGSQTRELRHGGEGTPSKELAPSRAGGLWGDGTRLGSSGEAPTVQRARTGGTSPSCRTGLLTAYIQHGPDISIPRLCRSPDFIFLFFFFGKDFLPLRRLHSQNHAITTRAQLMQVSHQLD